MRRSFMIMQNTSLLKDRNLMKRILKKLYVLTLVKHS
nr:MAG TPA: hypothetical protein [Crassvirales sp.]DAP79223.1 MAG TPA: hypothetical protein [Caudoviricetes sp.]